MTEPGVMMLAIIGIMGAVLGFFLVRDRTLASGYVFGGIGTIMYCMFALELAMLHVMRQPNFDLGDFTVNVTLGFLWGLVASTLMSWLFFRGLKNLLARFPKLTERIKKSIVETNDAA